MVRRPGSVAFEEPLSQPFQGAAENQRYYDESHGCAQDNPVTQSANETKHGADPNRCRRREAADVAIGIVQNHASAQKAYAGQDTLNYPANRVLVRGQRTVGRFKDNDRGDGRAEAYQSVGPQPGRLPMQLAVQAQNGADKQRGAEAHCCFFIAA